VVTSTSPLNLYPERTTGTPFMGRGTGLNVFPKRNISFSYREWNHSSELSYY